MGTLRITGVIDLKQFWPEGSSDADTTKVKLIVGEDSFMYRQSDDAEFVPTRVYEGAKSKGKISTEVIKFSKRNNSNSITIRLQGLDAPELHFRAAPLKQSDDITAEERKFYNSINKERRQCFAESATVILRDKLEKYADADGLLPATFFTNVDYPQDAIDTYGRFVGNIYVNDEKLDINIWLLENGAATPAFYTSMTKEEIALVLDAWTKGKKLKNRIGKMISKDAGKFDWELLYRKHGEDVIFDMDDDKGDSIMPKIYRRQVAWMVYKKAKIISGSMKFTTYLKEYTKDQFCYTDEFLEYGKDSCYKYNIDEIITTDNKILINAEDIMFNETQSVLVNARNKVINNW
jgi:endonuclease YncB( thermonuclease family)